MNNQLMKSTPLVNAENITGSTKSQMDNFQIEIYNGTPPVSADAALSGNTLLSKIVLAGSGTYNLVFDTTSVNGVLTKPSAATWSCASNLATGTATFFRAVQTGDTGALATTEKRIQGLCGTDGTYALFLATTALVSGASLTLNVGQVINPAN